MQRMLLTLLDGTTVFIRPIAPEDKALLVSGLRHLSPETAYRRFLSPKVRFSDAELRYLTEVDGHDHIAYVAVDGDTLVAVGRVVRTTEDRRDTADMAIVVGDPWQGLGLGRRLATLLAEKAAAGGRDPDRGHDAGRQPSRAAADEARRHRLRARRALARRARSRHSSGRRTASTLKRPCAGADGPESEPPSQYQRAARRHSRRPRRAADARARRRRLGRPRRARPGPEALSAALQHRGWDAVLYGGEGPEAVPSRKALALVRLADPHLPFVAVSPHMRAGELSAVLRGLPSGVPTVHDLAQLSARPDA